MDTTSTVRDYTSHALWHYVWKLLRLEWMIFWSGLRRARLRRKIGYALTGLFVLALMAGAFAFSWFLLSFLRSPQLAEFIDPDLFLLSVPALITSIAFLGILLTSFGVLLQALYLAGDLDFLLSAPVPIRAVFVTKLAQAILPNLGFVGFFGLPVLYGLGASANYTPLYYPLVVIVLVGLALAAAGLSSLLVMGVVRLFPARRVAEVLGFIGAVVSILCSQSGQLVNQAEISEAQAQAQASQALALLARFNTPWSPLAWAGRGLVDVGEGRWASGAAFLLLTFGLAGAVFALALVTAERLYYSGWASIQIGTRKKKAARPSRPLSPGSVKASAPARLLELVVPAPVRGIVAKDWLVLRRDLRHMSQLITPMIVGVIYAMMLARNRGQVTSGQDEVPAWMVYVMKDMLTYASVGISLFVGWSLLSRLAMMSFSQEGRHYWLLKVAPLRSGQLLLAKFLVAYLPTLALSSAFLLVVSLVQGAGPDTLLFGLLVVALCLAGEAGLGLAFGVVGVNLEWDDPRRMIRGPLGCLGMLVSMVYMVVMLGLFFVPPLAFAAFGGPQAAGQLIGLALGGLASLACALLPPWLVHERVARIGE
jgi:ABC-2 type transport system permease protein